MKTRNIVISMLVATIAMTACNKQDTTPAVPSNDLMTVEISLRNLNFTKAPTDAFVTDQTKAQLNDFKVYLTDGSELYSAKALSDVTPAYYFSVASGSALPEKVTIDLVPAAVSKVVVVGNVNSADWGPDPAADGTFTEDLDALKGEVLEIAKQQNYKNLTLFGEASLELSGNTHLHSDNTTYGVYTADVQLAPLVSRFEIDGFAMTYSTTNPKFDKVEVKQVALNRYYSSTVLNPLTPVTLVNGIETANDKNVMDYFSSNLLVTGDDAWYYDAGLGISLAKADADADGLVKSDLADGKKLSYHFFPASEVPQLFIELAVTPAGESVSLPSYIYSKSFKKSDGTDVTFTPGYVYRMNFAGAANDGDGDIPFTEDNIDQIEKCLDITVDVIPWTVVSIYPEF